MSASFNRGKSSKDTRKASGKLAHTFKDHDDFSMEATVGYPPEATTSSTNNASNQNFLDNFSGAENDEPGKESGRTPNRIRNYSLSEAFNYNNNFNNPNFDISGRSYISMSHRPSVLVSTNSPQVNTGVEVHEQTANLANIGVVDSEEAGGGDDVYDTSIPEEQFSGQFNHSKSKHTHISGYERPSSSPTYSNITPLLTEPRASYTEGDDEDTIGISQHPKSSNGKGMDFKRSSDASTTPHGAPTIPEKQTQPSSLHQLLVKPFQFIPGVFLGTLLNILDGLSYGMIMFPISEPIFAALAPAGLSMFYVSCIVSQLVYSLGGSAFKAGIGSEMIEVTPFFHTMAFSISRSISSDTSVENQQDAIIATTITSYAISSIVTGLVFFLLGKLKLGVLVGFFPRHILVGCIGGVGYFLIATGIEVSSRLEGGLTYNYETFKYLFYNHITFLEWTVPLVLAVILIFLQHKIHNSLLVPGYFIAVFAIFHLIVLLIPSWNLNDAREMGWVFPAVEGDQPWFEFYSLYKFQLVDWLCILRQTPTMLALTFFGILHVPINVPALAVSVGMDDVDVDRELVAHGYSNAISGLVGSIQNYLVYTNSVLFIRAGANDRLAGIMLAVATAAVMIAGPVVIGYIPVCVVGALIYLLGYELLKESVWDTIGRLRKIEYSTIIIIVVTMGAVDFVAGIGIGILLACLSFVVEAAGTPVVQGIYSGSVARSTVLRHPKQQEFLKNVGEQICIVKLQGTIFFGSIGGVEKEIRLIFETDKFDKRPVKFLIIDMKEVISLDFSAAEGFRRILNLANEFKTQLIISGVSEEDETIQGLRDAGLFENSEQSNGSSPPIELFSSLNYALEWCENSFLKTYKSLKKGNHMDPVTRHTSSRSVPGAKANSSTTNTPVNLSLGGSSSSMARSSSIQSPSSFSNKLFNQFGGEFGTPRTKQVLQAASKTVYDEQKTQHKLHMNANSQFLQKQPLPLMMITFQGLCSKDAEFWAPLAPYFVKESIPENIQFYNTAEDEPSFFIVESGLVRSVIKFGPEGRELHSSIVPLVAFGDLDDASYYRPISYTTVNDSVVWKLSKANIKEMLKSQGSKGETLYHELLEIEAKLIRERFDTMTANLIISG
ncbi:hypothetical protein CANMA_002249 [Candida margitis]|uniref:uncharacterized protein n=1 Tax=Candida margitis TaxID=1775924 RepID=UPI002226FEEB|nr:uncharacterized protein CANMA_002249 [Candida margitis]KAI5968813.1 hypothetical protein CANMA_002249 [Candida margitis]